MRRSADGRGDLNGAVGSAPFLRLKGALCVSLMMRTLVLIVDAMLAVHMDNGPLWLCGIFPNCNGRRDNSALQKSFLNLTDR
jgi:hypothetical protein